MRFWIYARSRISNREFGFNLDPQAFYSNPTCHGRLEKASTSTTTSTSLAPVRIRAAQLRRLNTRGLTDSGARRLGGSRTRGLADSGAERRSRHHIDSVSPRRLLAFDCSSSTPSAMSILQLSFFTLLYAMIPRPICILDQSPEDDYAVAHKPRGLQNYPLDHAQFYMMFICVHQSSEAGYQKATLVSGFNKSGIASLLPGKSMLLEGLLMKRHA